MRWARPLGAMAALGVAVVGIRAVPFSDVGDRETREAVPPVTAPAARAEAPAPDPVTPQEPERTGGFAVADAAVSAVALHGMDGRPTGQVLTNPTRYDVPLVFRVLEGRGAWLVVQVPIRPNGGKALIRSRDVRLRTVPNWIEVRLATRQVTVYEGLTAVYAAVGAVGRATSVTPSGWFYVDASVRLTDERGPYGSGQLTLSGYSEVYTTFGDGDGQIALHGTNAPGLLGQAASNGCVRLANDAFLRIQELAPTGTPVHIVD